MENIYDFLLDNIYVFCIIMAAFFIMIVVVFYYVQNRKYNNNNKDVDYDIPSDINKEELEKITDEEIEKRVLEEYQKDKEETIKEIEQEQNEEEDLKNVITEQEEAADKKTETNIEEIISALEQAKRTEPSEVLKTFEEEQEEQAIISYKQLVESVKNNKIKIVDDEQFYKEQEKANEEEKYKLLVNELENEPVIATSKDAYNGSSGGYKANEFISPVFGRMDSSNVLYRQGLEYTDKKPKKEEVKEEYHNDKVKDIYDDYLNKNEENINEKPKYSDRETLYRYKNNYEEPLVDNRNAINKDTEILSEDVNNYDKLNMKHAPKMDSEEFLNKLKQFRNNL